MSESKSGKRKFLHVLLKILAGFFSVVLIALIGALLVLAQPKSDENEKPQPQPLLTASPELKITAETELRSLVESFPVPVLSFMSGSGMSFVSGSSSDVSLNSGSGMSFLSGPSSNTSQKDGVGRMVTLYWQTPDGDPLILQSIYPASALSLLDNGYHFSTVAGPTLFGADSVRMENDDTVRIHAATDTGLYVITVPKSAASKISSLSRSLQLFSLKPSAD